MLEGNGREHSAAELIAALPCNVELPAELRKNFEQHGVAPFAEAEPGNVNGPRAMRSTAEWLLAQFPDLHFTVEEIVAEGNTVAVRLLGEGTNLGPIGPLPPTGRRFSARSSHWFRVANGKLAEHWATRDDLTAMVQLGIVHRPSRQPS